MDGVCFVNVVVLFGVYLFEIMWCVGVDVFCFGGMKNGLLVGEVVVFFDCCLVEDFVYCVKQVGQFVLKMCFILVLWLGLFENDVWLCNVCYGNVMVQFLYVCIVDVLGVCIMFLIELNVVFVELLVFVIEVLCVCGWCFYMFIGVGGCCLMCLWDV